jgi:uncharacterized repeat protein (TIGR01451 family)
MKRRVRVLAAAVFVVAGLSVGLVSPAAAKPPAAAPTLTTVFGSPTVLAGFADSLTFTIVNAPTSSVPLTGVNFADALPAGLKVLSGTSTVCGGTLTTTKPSGIALTGATIALGGSCSFSVTIYGVTPGVDTNTAGPVFSNEASPSSVATATVEVWVPPTASLSFSVASIEVGDTASLTSTIANPAGNVVAFWNVSVTYVLPAGLTPGAVINTCGVRMVPTATGFELQGVALSVGGSCAVSMTVQGATPGAQTATATIQMAGDGWDGNVATAVLAVTAPPTPPTPTPTPALTASPTAHPSSAATAAARTPVPSTAPAVPMVSEGPSSSASKSLWMGPSSSPTIGQGSARSASPGLAAIPAIPASPGARGGSVLGSSADTRGSGSGLLLVAGGMVAVGLLACLAIFFVIVTARRRRLRNHPEALQAVSNSEQSASGGTA